MDNSEMEGLLIELITNAGEARSCAMQALYTARENKWQEVDECLRQAKQAVREAHKIQTRLIGMDEGEGKVKVTLITVHAQDHLMNALLCLDLAEEIIVLRKEIAVSQ
ncbi:PTS lactose/cellobiose transporter subunit IIA [Affinibrenneria salicis]|uniref:PTS lactose/cellobiose transporter subunit IIA n=1 Tax=Affinibrenneria salicis TaxID=2590031 RepID=A0A5J5G4W2_9GAMM|nr:PTS lactose/cellobiose transporter subunit IIA [Affinibrenneria salicis]KAA9001254.1 PTS lactose/cellobiose transporter subunit IIA [Affinibrenneria salicis]